MIKRNIMANVVGRVWGVLSAYLFIPLYLKLLGAEAYGLVAFFATLSGVLAFADMGLTATLNREMARLSVRKDSGGEQADLLRTYESAYAWLSLLLALAIWFLAPLITQHWLQATMLNSGEIVTVLRLMGVAIALQLPTNLFIGGLVGLQKQTLSNALQIGSGLLRGVGGLLILWLVAPSLPAFFGWQLICNVIYCWVARSILWRSVAPCGNVSPHFRLQVFRNTWRYAAGMAGMTVLSAILTQTDKLAVSKLLPLATFGHYTLAVAMAHVPRMLAGPIGTAVLPRLTGLVATGNQRGLVRLYRQATALIGITAIPAGITVAFFCSHLIFAWTGNFAAATQVGLAGSLLVFGELLQAAAYTPFYLALANGNVRLNLQVNAGAVVLITPLLILLIERYGLIGAGASWVVVNLCTLPPYLYFVHRRFLPGELGGWFVFGVGRPLLAALPCVLIGRWLMPSSMSRVGLLLFIGLVWATATASAIAFNPEFRSLIIQQSRSILRRRYYV